MLRILKNNPLERSDRKMFSITTFRKGKEKNPGGHSTGMQNKEKFAGWAKRTSRLTTGGGGKGETRPLQTVTLARCKGSQQLP